MNKGSTKFKCTATAIIMLILVSIIAWIDYDVWARVDKPSRISLLLATGLPGSVDYQVGMGLASLWTTKLKNPGIRVSAAISEGAKENIEAIRISDADLIIADEYYSLSAYFGKGPFKDGQLRQLRSITVLWPELFHLMIRSEKYISGSIQDLENLTVGTGLSDGASRLILELLLKENLGPKKDIKIKNLSNIGLLEAWKSGSIQASCFSGGLPLPIVNFFVQQHPGTFRFLQISDSEIATLTRDAMPCLTRMSIPAGTYIGQDQEIQTMGQKAFLLTSVGLEEQVVYELTKAMFTNLDYLVRIHPAFRHVTLEQALSGLQIPLHRGALKFFREKNLQIPDELLQE